MSNVYLAVQIRGDRNETTFMPRSNPDVDIGYYAYVLKTNENQNLVSELDMIGGLVSANVCRTRKRAVELVEFWNSCYKQNGTYLFEKPNF